jgi:uncharacterized protein YkwD
VKNVVGVLVVALLLLASSAAASTGRSAAIDRAFDTALVQQINQLRAQHGLAPFRTSLALERAAAVHTRDMVAAGYFAHRSSDGTPFWQRLERFYGSKGFRSWSVGENLVWGTPDLTGSAALDDWLRSPEHRANLLSRTWRDIGLAALHVPSAPGTYGDQETTVVTADFGVRNK